MGLVHVLPELPGPTAWRVWTAFAVMSAFAMALPFARQARTHWLAWALLAAIAGSGLTASRAGLRMAEVPSVDIEGQVMTLTGRVASLPQRTDGIGGVEGWRRGR